ncbi:tetratricopeptide repeat protein, partial [Allocoleopsis sp.]|uniref:tetratricopeptide repeat protein n=1 Tax=Allocoleopsis sp. TaxID=3088169 RepID=UPI002FD4FEB8
ELGNHDAALADYEKAISLNPNSARAFYNRGLTRNRLNQHQSAIQDYSEAIRLQPTFAEAFYNRGLSRFNLKNYKEAIDDLNKAAALFKQNGRTENSQSAMDVIKTIQDLGKS